MRGTKIRILDFLGKVEGFFWRWMVCKRHVYLDAYNLLTSAYFPVYPAAYLPFTGKPESRLKRAARLVTRLEKIAQPWAFYSFSKHMKYCCS